MSAALKINFAKQTQDASKSADRPLLHPVESRKPTLEEYAALCEKMSAKVQPKADMLSAKQLQQSFTNPVAGAQAALQSDRDFSPSAYAYACFVLK